MQRHKGPFRATRLRIINVAGTVEVRVGEARTMEVEVVEGSAWAADAIACEVVDGELQVRGRVRAAAPRVTLSGHDRGGSVVNMISGPVTGSVLQVGAVVGGVSFASPGRLSDLDWAAQVDVAAPTSEERVRLVVTVPLTASVAIVDKGVDGAYEVGDTQGLLDVELAGSGTVRAGKVGATRVRGGGTPGVEVAQVRGEALDVEVSGAPDVRIDGGEVDDARVRLVGGGRVEFLGTADYAELATVGGGEVRVRRTRHRPQKKVVRGGRIVVDEEPRASERATPWD